MRVDLRARRIGYVGAGNSLRRASKIFKVSKSTIER
ncbi:IS630 transposase-related protein [Candidatus Tisiphia endosymbiont of Beris chalybata]